MFYMLPKCDTPWPHQVATEHASRRVPLLRLADDHRLAPRLRNEHRITHCQAGHVLRISLGGGPHPPKKMAKNHGKTGPKSMENLMFNGKIWENDVNQSNKCVYQ